VKPDELLGTWSVDAQYGPGAMDDQLLHFRADGLGCLEHANLAGASAVTFRWRLEADRLTTSTLGTYRTPDGAFEPFDVDPGGTPFDLVQAAISIATEDTLAGVRMRILRLPTGSEHGLLDSLGYVREAPPPDIDDLMDLHR